MSGEQTTIEPCVICGEPSVERREVLPAEYDTKGNLKRLALYQWLCATHAAHADTQAGWQDRAAKERAARRKALKRAQEDAPLFDGDAGAPPGMGRAA